MVICKEVSEVSEKSEAEKETTHDPPTEEELEDDEEYQRIIELYVRMATLIRSEEEDE